jgi:hypothetical protein
VRLQNLTTALKRRQVPCFSGLPDMTGVTIFFKRTGAISLVTAGTLLMKSIGPFGHFFISFIGIMAFTA